MTLCNDNEYGLSAALLTHNLELAWSLGLRMEAGMVHINDTTFLSGTTAPSGGVKFSGFGREGGRYSMEDFTELKWLTMQVAQKDALLSIRNIQNAPRRFSCGARSGFVVSRYRRK